MDCEKFESAMMDELYGELDELTSVAAKRHIASCARCAARMSGLRATRRVATVPLVDPPAGLEERILAAARDAATVVPMRRRMAHAVSLAGSWAMRPQTAMAAVFLVMIGSSLLLLRGRAREVARAPVTVTEQGSPASPVASVPRAELPQEPASDYRGIAVAASVAAASPEPKPTAVATAAPRPAPAEQERALAFAKAPPRDEAENARGGPARPAPRPARAAPSPAGRSFDKSSLDDGVESTSGGEGYASGLVAQAPAPQAAAPAPAAAPPPAAQSQSRSVSAFDVAMGQYRSGQYDQAARGFDALAPGDTRAELWAARAVRQGRGCASAVRRFDNLAQRAPGTLPAWDALLEGALCYREISNFPEARARLNQLLNVDSHKDRARAELDRLDQMQQSGQRPQGVGASAPVAR
jgi:hypothetical protein